MSGRGVFQLSNSDIAKLKTMSDTRKSTEGMPDSGTTCDTNESARRLGRGKLLEDILSRRMAQTGLQTSSHFQPGHHGLRSAVTENQGNNSDSFGRAKLLQQLSQLDISPRSVENTSTQQSQKRSDPTFFKPDVIHGSAGKAVSLSSNYIRLKCDENKGVFVYEVRFCPNVDNVQFRVKYLNEHRDKFGGTKTFDGVTLYLPILLPNQMTVFVSKNIADNTNIEIRILFKRKEKLQSCIHLYNILFNRVMRTLDYVRFDRKQFDSKAPKIIPQAKLEVWPGYVTAVDEYEGDLMLCCDVSHRILCQKTVLEMLTETFYEDKKSGQLQFQENAKKRLLGAVVITRYNNETYRIDDIYFDQNPLCTFETSAGPVSYVDYYRKHYNIVIKDVKQPLLVSIKKQRGSDKQQTSEYGICLIPEICNLTGLNDEIRSNFPLMREIASFTRVSPNQRLLALQKFYTNINNSPQATEILSNWGLTLMQSCEVITGRQLLEEQIMFAKRSFGAGPNADFSKYATTNELLDVVPLQNWLVLHVRTDAADARVFVDHMLRNAPAMGIEIKKPQVFELQNDSVDAYVKALRTKITTETQIVVCICPKSRDDRYSAIKKICCAEIPVPSQVINATTLRNTEKNRSIVQKIALQMNCKLGGSLWTIKIPLKNVMICGIDSYHDASQKSNSVAAFVASLNSTYTKWYSKAIIQTKGEEIVSGLCSSFTAALAAYTELNSKLPDQVIIYRDGVGDGQLSVCTNYEIPQFEDVCRETYPGHPLKISFIVVQKRINTRFFLGHGNNARNPQPGTIVDSTITRKHMYDFFLVSQSVRQGTVSPSHYIVLRDDANFAPDILQRLSYKLCFLYYNWPGTIRIPACCQYAHKLAYLVGQSIRRATAEELANKLFYL